MNRMLMALTVAAVAACSAGAQETCEFGTKIRFVDTPKEAAVLAKKQEKLVFVLHVSGHFEDPGLT